MYTNIIKNYYNNKYTNGICKCSVNLELCNYSGIAIPILDVLSKIKFKIELVVPFCRVRIRKGYRSFND